MAEGCPQAPAPRPHDVEAELREVNQTAKALNVVAAGQVHTHSSPKGLLSGKGQGLPHGQARRKRGRGALEGQVAGRTLPVQCLLHPQLQLLLWRQLGLGRGRRGRRPGGCPGASTTHLIREPGTCGGTCVGLAGCGDGPRGSGSPSGQLRRAGRHRSQSPGLDLPAHPGPPAGPPGPALGHCCWRELHGRVPNSY